MKLRGFDLNNLEEKSVKDSKLFKKSAYGEYVHVLSVVLTGS